MKEVVENMIKGRVKVVPRYKDTNEEIPLDTYLSMVGITREEAGFDEEGYVDNMVVKSIHQVMAYLFVNSSLANNKIYLGVGSGTTPVTREDLSLVTELQRVEAKRSYDLTYSLAVLDPNDATRSNCVRLVGTIGTGNFDINEIGLFWGDTATTTTNSGKLMSRVVASRPIPKLDNIQLDFIWIYIFRFLN
jgi:hypothetical protein